MQLENISRAPVLTITVYDPCFSKNFIISGLKWRWVNSTVSLSYSSNTRFLQSCNILDVTDDSRQASCIMFLHYIKGLQLVCIQLVPATGA